MSLLAVGVSHRTAPVALLEQFAMTPEDRVKALHELVGSDHVSEALVLATCNRIEVFAEVAQGVCDRLVATGIRSILNFAPVTLAAPPDVDVRQVDLSVELQVLAFLGQRRVPQGAAAGGRAGASSPSA